MKDNPFNIGDKVKYGTVIGTVVGFYYSLHAIIYLDRPNYYAYRVTSLSDEIPINKVINTAIQKFFGDKYKEIILDKGARFMDAPIFRLEKIVKPDFSIDEWYRKRHMYMQLAHSYIRNRTAPDTKIQEICIKIEDLQKKLEANYCV